MDARKPTYDQLSALCAQMAAALEAAKEELDALWSYWGQNLEVVGWHQNGATEKLDNFFESNDFGAREGLNAALTAYRTLSPDPQWQRVPEGCVVVPEEPNDAIISAGIWTKDHGACGETTKAMWSAMVKAANRARGEADHGSAEDR